MIEKAKWIWANTAETLNQYAEFIAEINIREVSKEAVLEICADSEYAVYINGEFAGSGQYDDYPDEKVYDEIPVAGFLKPGKNRICIVGYYQGVQSMQYAKGERALRFAFVNGEQILMSDNTVLAAISPCYKSGEIYKITNQLGYGAICDASKEDDWLTGEIPGRFTPCIQVKFDTKLVPRPIKRLEIGAPVPGTVKAQGRVLRKGNEGNAASLMQSDYLSACRFYELFDGKKTLPGEITAKTDEDIYLIVDLNKEESGCLFLDLETSAGTRIDIGYGEHLDDLRVRTNID